MFSKSGIKKLFDAGRWPLTARLSLFFSLATAVIVVGVSVMMYSELVEQLRDKEEAELRDDLQIQQDVLEHLVRKQVPSQWQHEWGEYQEDFQKFAWQLLAPDRRVRAASPNAGTFGAALAHAGMKPGFVRWADRTREPARYFLVLDVAVDTPGREAAKLGGPRLGPQGTVLRGVLDVSRDQHVLRAYRTKLAGVIVLAIVLSAGAGWLLARRGLAPVRAISKEIGRINAEKLHARIASEAWPSDLRVLASTFDDMLARLEQSFAQLTRFSSDLAHEFRSPINNLVAAASVTLARARDPAEYQKTLEVVVEEGQRLSRMVSSMLFLARADNAGQHLHLERVALADEFRKLVDFYEIAAEEQGVTLLAQGEGELMVDPVLLRRALSNLLANALRYTPRGGSVRLSATRERGAVAIAVSDDGKGIATEHLPFLFDRFYRADTARSSADSTGLGLAVVRSIAELHGGKAEVVSVLGKGSSFTLRFPTA
jgi:two-component system heavy metal sensor histidine kinase CusS